LLNKIDDSAFVTHVVAASTWDYQEAKWLEQYERLCEYESKLLPKNKNNKPSNTSTSTSTATTTDNSLEFVFKERYQEDPVLKRWVNAQRLKYRKESISAERVRLLDQVEGFFWDVKEARWAEMYRRLYLYALQHNGSCRVPQTYKEDPQLACWVNNQRQRRKQLTSERIQLLDGLGFVWDVREIQWLEFYDRYKALFFGESKGGGRGGGGIPMTTEMASDNNNNDNTSEEKLKQLDTWAIQQRTSYRNGTLSAYRVQRLEELKHPIDGHGFAWDPHEQNWMELFRELEEFRSKHNHAVVPRRPRRSSSINNRDTRCDDDATDTDATSSDQSESSKSNRSKQLGIWSANQRTSFKKGTLSKKRIRLLDGIGFVWDVPQARQTAVAATTGSEDDQRKKLSTSTSTSGSTSASTMVSTQQ